jgi:hypothetical protein
MMVMSVHSNSKSSKPVYVSPRLQVYGDVLKLTAAGTRGNNEPTGQAPDPARRA